MHAITLTPHRNLLALLLEELEDEARQAQRRADDAGTRALELEAHGVNTDTALLTAHLENARDRGVQDALVNVAGRLRSILLAPLSTVVDVGAIFDAVEGRLTTARWTGSNTIPTPITPSLAARVAAEVIDGRNVGDK